MTKEEAITRIRDHKIVHRMNEPRAIYLSEALDMAIKALEQEPTYKTGRWIKYCIPRCKEQHYQCTSCGHYINFGQWDEFYTKEFKYCPYCGARYELYDTPESEKKNYPYWDTK